MTGVQTCALPISEVVVSYFEPVRKQTEELLAEPKTLQEIMAEGAEKARSVASKTLSDVYNALGLVPPR